MSYQIVKSVNVKEKSITSATSNIRPLTYEKWFTGLRNQEMFIKHFLINAVDGYYKMSVNSKNLFRFNYALYLYNTLLNADSRIKFNKIRWNNYDYSTNQKKYSDEIIKKATEDLENLLYEYYKTKFTYGKYIIKIDAIGYFRKITKQFCKIDTQTKNAKVFNTFEEATMFARQIEKKFHATTKVVELKK